MKVLVFGHFVEPPFAEGEVNTILNWVKGVQIVGIDVTVLSLSTKFSGFKTISGINFEYVKTKKPRFECTAYNLMDIQKIILSRLDFDLVHFASSLDGLSIVPTLSMLKLSHRKTISSYSTLDCFSEYSHWFSKLFYNCVTIPSERMLNCISRKVPSSRVFLLPSCVDTNYFCPRNKNKVRAELGLHEDYFTIFSTGHFRRGRLLIPLIKLVSKMSARGEKVQLLIGWTGQGEKDCISDIFRLTKNCNNIKITPPTSDINLYYNASDIYVLSASSNYVIETPLSLLEAAASGVPALAFNINASSEVLIDGVSGYIMQKNAFHEMEQKISMLAKNSTLLESMSVNARLIAQRSFSLKSVGCRLGNLYSTLVG